jgi:hypothetical protein
LTAVPSINAMLEPKIVAARIHGPEALEHGATAAPERIRTSSQGG